MLAIKENRIYETKEIIEKEKIVGFEIVVLIPHYNNLEGLRKSLISIAHVDNLKVLIVDDGSDENHLPHYDSLETCVNNNVSIDIISQFPNKGIDHALNLGLKYIRTNIDCKFIARLDCGDTCRESRFAVQADFLENNPDISLVGSWVNFTDTEGNHLFTFKPPAHQRGIEKSMQMNCSFIHPSVMYRREAIDKIGLYPTNYKAAEDYAYFYKFTENFKTANIRKALTTVELNPKGISITKRKQQLYSRLKVMMSHSKLDYRTIYGIGRTMAMLMVPYKYIEKIKTQRSK